MIIKKGRRLFVIRRSLMGDVVVNDGRLGRVGEANSRRGKQPPAGFGRPQDNGVALD
jgi:hypothetical protein